MHCWAVQEYAKGPPGWAALRIVNPFGAVMVRFGRVNAPLILRGYCVSAVRAGLCSHVRCVARSCCVFRADYFLKLVFARSLGRASTSRALLFTRCLSLPYPASTPHASNPMERAHMIARGRWNGCDAMRMRPPGQDWRVKRKTALTKKR